MGSHGGHPGVKGYLVRAAQNGLEGLDQVEHSIPDLILLNLQMPIMGAEEFARRFRGKHGPSMRIVVISASPEVGRVAGQMGAVDWLTKPFGALRLL